MLRIFKNHAPKVAPSAYVDESAQILGDVVIGEESSVWMNNVQDGTIVHVMRDPSHPTTVGDDVTVGHGVILHGCTVADRCLIGMGAILLNGSSVGEDCIVAAGTLLPEGTAVPARSLVMGSPGKVRRPLTDDEVAFILQSAQNYVAYRLEYMQA